MKFKQITKENVLYSIKFNDECTYDYVNFLSFLSMFTQTFKGSDLEEKANELYDFAKDSYDENGNDLIISSSDLMDICELAIEQHALNK